MKLVIDTNVFISGAFFSGPPHEILKAWSDGFIRMIISPEIFAEYQETGEKLALKFPDVDINPWFELVATVATFVNAPQLSEQICTDPDDDMFLACAIASKTKLVTSGDKALLETSGFKGVTVLTPRKFVDKYLQ